MEDGRIDSYGYVLESDPPKRFAITWRVEWLADFRQLPESQVTFQIDKLGNVVRLTVSEFHHPNLNDKYVDGGRKGWPIILSGLKSLLETGQSLPKFNMS